MLLMLLSFLLTAGYDRAAPTFTCKPNAWYVRCEAVNVYPYSVTWEVWPPGGLYHKDFDEGVVAYLKANPGDAIRMTVHGNRGLYSVQKVLDKDRIIR